jgi:hypothetical protein
LAADGDVTVTGARYSTPVDGFFFKAYRDTLP